MSMGATVADQRHPIHRRRRVARRLLIVVVTVALVGAGLLALLWSQQRRLIYFPSRGPVPAAAAVLRGGQDVALQTEDGLRLGAWFMPAEQTPAPTVLVFNGNAGNRSGRAALAEAFNRMGLSVLLFDYRGYGGNPGRPSEDGLAADARGARAWLAGRAEVDQDRIVYFGESLGAAVALGLAVQQPPAALILRSPFTSLGEVGALHFRWLPVRRLLTDEFPSIERIGSLTAPLLVITGTNEDIVPEWMSHQLFDAAPEPKRYVLVPGVGHNDPALLNGPQMVTEIERFLSERGVR